MDSILLLFTKRPYVIAFLFSYVILSWRLCSPKFMIKFLIVGYAIAWASEALSIRTGFPYGWYFYNYDELAGEILIFGVPIWDSASYVFMNFAGLCYAKTILPKKSKPALVVLISALAVTLLDVIVDPVSHLGDQWFLGNIYFYKTPGWYFAIPFSNFAGWFLVSVLISGFGIWAWPKSKPEKNLKLGVGLYFGIFGFGLAIAIYLKQWGLVVADLLWFCVLAIPMAKQKIGTNRPTQHVM